MRRKSAIDIAKQKDRIERARKMSPDERLMACVSISAAVVELARAGKRYREEKLPQSR